jgi:acetylornithine deacetylase/succinyl-diaminopimelate desuccinylase-like protein
MIVSCNHPFKRAFVLIRDFTGSTDDKGPILGWINVLEAHKALGKELPVNLRFCFEGMEESGSEGLDDFINSEAKKPNGWFEGVDCVCIVSRPRDSVEKIC